MIRIRILAVGKTREEWIKQGTNHYCKLLGRYAQVDLEQIKEEKITRSKKAGAILETEGDRVLQYLHKEEPAGSFPVRVALDKGGQQLSSEALAGLFEDRLNRGHSQFTFIVGGALGLSPKVLDACEIKLSLSTMTFTHEMSRIILLEQIYRALSILKGTDYHK